jgi:hypothetical protein
MRRSAREKGSRLLGWTTGRMITLRERVILRDYDALIQLITIIPYHTNSIK